MELFISEEFGVFLIEDYHLDAIILEFGARADWVARDPGYRGRGQPQL